MHNYLEPRLRLRLQLKPGWKVIRLGSNSILVGLGKQDTGALKVSSKRVDRGVVEREDGGVARAISFASGGDRKFVRRKIFDGILIAS
ncbi:hypothetical protein TNCT_685611 [Trichonephila clavata]|uniref:Uncharacterized protein n=1 Tax=Trichonephila clavata TaxID=2740835 RepID=A0A8X6KUQ1_TRICU|nr:hypothetical protein TNCT_685611 [Trichonephila clavata]